MNHLSIMVRELTDELNNIVADMEYKKDEDADNNMTLILRAGIILEIIEKLIIGRPVVMYDLEIKKPYLFYPDGRRKY